MNIYVIEHQLPASDHPVFWTGLGMTFTPEINEALWLVRERDARVLLSDNPMLPGMPSPKTIASKDAQERADGV